MLTPEKLKIVSNHLGNHNDLNEIVHSHNPVIFLTQNKIIFGLNKGAKHLFKAKHKDIVGKNIKYFLKTLGISLPINNSITLIDNTVFHNVKTVIRQSLDTKHTITWNMLYIGKHDLFGHYSILIGKHVNKKYKEDSTLNATSQQKFFSHTVSETVTNINEKTRKHEPYNKNCLFYITQSLPGYANIKNVKNFIYEASNTNNANLLGCKQSIDLLGKKVDDITHLSKKYIHQIHECDEQALANKQAIVGIKGEPFFDATGKVKELVLTKIPLLDSYKNVTGIFTLAFGATELSNPERVRSLYKILCDDKTTAHKRFLQHIELSDSQLTERELDCLIALSKYRTHKCAAFSIGMAPKTIETHLARIKGKMGCCTISQTIDKFLSKYRNA